MSEKRSFTNCRASVVIFFTIFLMLMPLFALSKGEKGGVFESARNELKSIMEVNGTLGLSVVVVKNGKIIFSHNMGLKSIESGDSIKERDIFRIASISKSFTATAIMQLIDKGLICEQSVVGEILGFPVINPKFPESPITIAHLLSHTSGLNDSQGYFSLDSANPSKNVDFAKCYNSYSPGGGYEYCNLGFNMLGAIIEKVSGERFDNYIKHHIIDPLGLYAGFNPDSLDRSRFVSLYSFIGTDSVYEEQKDAYKSRSKEMENYKLGYSTPLFSPTGGMKISPYDLARYMIMHMNYGKAKGERIISKRSSKKMQSPVFETGDGESYCYALRVTDNLVKGERLIGHTGSAYGLYSAMFFSHEDDFGVVMMTNGTRVRYKDGFTTLQADVIRAMFRIFNN